MPPARPRSPAWSAASRAISGPRRITANLVNPGPIATERNNGGDSDRGNVAEGPLVLKRYGTPDEVAALVVHLARPEGAYITGQVYNVDGGWTV